MKRKFSLIELLVVIGVLGILASIILPNTSDMKEKAHKSALNSNIRNLQTASDMFGLDHYGNFIGVDKPTLLVPQSVDFNKIKPEFVRNHSKVPNAKYWTDVNGQIWGSTTDAPLNVIATANKLDWEGNPSAASYKIFEVKDKQSTSSIVRYTFTEVQNLPKETTSYTGQVGKQYAVSAVDKNNFVTAPVGLGGQGGYTGYEDTLESGNNGQSGTTNPPTNPGNGGGTTTPTNPDPNGGGTTTPTPKHDAPVAVLDYTPSTNITINSIFTWSTDNSTTSDGATIVDVEWKVDNVAVTAAPTKFDKDGTYKVEVRVKDSQDAWSDWVSKDIVIAPDPNSVVMASAGLYYTLALKANGDLYGFGDNSLNQISSSSSIRYSATPIRLTGNIRYTYAGEQNAIAITKDDVLYVWGSGGGSAVLSQYRTSIASNVKSAIVKRGVLWYLTNDGNLYGRGFNLDGLMGNSTNLGALKRNDNSSLIATNVVSFDINGGTAEHGVFVKKDGSIWSMGKGDIADRTGKRWDANNNYIPIYTPVKVGDGAKSVQVLSSGVYILDTNGTVNTYADGNFNLYTTDVKEFLPNYRQKGGILLIKNDGTIWGIGERTNFNFKQLSHSPLRQLIVQSSMFNIKSENSRYASIGETHGVVVKDDGTLWTQGYNTHGQLGNSEGAYGSTSTNAIHYDFNQVKLP